MDTVSERTVIRCQGGGCTQSLREWSLGVRGEGCKGHAVSERTVIRCQGGECRVHTVSERTVIRCQGVCVGCTQSLREWSLGVRGGV